MASSLFGVRLYFLRYLSSLAIREIVRGVYWLMTLMHNCVSLG